MYIFHRSKQNQNLYIRLQNKKRHKLATLFNSVHISYNAPSVLLTETRKCCKKAIFKKMTLLQKYCSNKYNVCFTSPQNSYICHILFQIPFNNGRQSKCFESQSETIPRISMNIGKSYFQNSTVMHKNLFYLLQ